MNVATRSASKASAHGLWIPRQHGAWPMLAVPLLIGVAVGGFSPWQVVLAAAAASGYLAVVATQTWLRAKRRARYRTSVVAFGAVAFGLAVVLVVGHPILLLAGIVLVPGAGITLAASKPGQSRTLVEGFAEVAQALVLVPAAAYLASPSGEAAVGRATLAAGIYLAGTVFAVRSVIRERDNLAFAGASVAFHLVGTVLALIVLPLPYVPFFAALTVAAAILPVVRRRLAEGTRPLRPIHVGIVEMAASIVLVALAFGVPL